MRNRFLKGTSMIAIAMMATANAAAQDADADEEDDIEEISVTGIRASLQSAQAMKRNADTFLDGISAKDLGAFPDRSVLEAIQRVPGVAIERFAASDDPDHFSVEGSGAVVRGLNQVRSEFNGRDTFTANSNYGLSFQDVPPELMGAVEIYKNQSAKLIEGGIAGVVNLKTRVPFDSDGQVMSFSADATYSDFIEKTTPSFSGLYSNRWEVSGGEFGLLLNASYSRLKARTDGVQAQPVIPTTGSDTARDRNGNIAIPASGAVVGGNIRRQDHDRERVGVAAAVQWQNPDKTVLATAQFLRSDASQSWLEHSISLADELESGNGSLGLYVPAQGTTFDYGSDGVFQNGVIQNNAGWRGGDPRIANAWDGGAAGQGGTYGSRFITETRQSDLDTVTSDYSFNLKYTPSSQLRFDFDLQYVDSTSDRVDTVAALATYATQSLDLRDGTPKIGWTSPTSVEGDPSYKDHTSADAFYWRHAMDHIEDSEGDEVAGRLDMEYDVNEGWLQSIEAGVRFAERDQTTRWAEYNWGVLSETWASPIAWADQYNTGGVEQFTFDNFHRGGVLQGNETFMAVIPSLVQSNQALYGAVADIGPRGWVPLDMRDGVIPGTSFRDREVNHTNEQNKSAFVQFNFNNENITDGTRISGNIGVRFVETTIGTEGSVSFPDPLDESTISITLPGGEEIVVPYDPNTFLPADDAAFINGFAETQTAKYTYRKWLPSFNLKAELTDNLIARFAISKAMSRPALGLLRNFVQMGISTATVSTEPGPEDDPATFEPEVLGVNVNGYSANAGNPFLKPMMATQWDASLEWYFDDVGQLSATVFHKDVKDYFINGVTQREFTNNGVTRTVNVSGPSNGDKGKIDGFEISYQQFYDMLPAPFDGLGLQANYTYVKSSGIENSNLRPVDSNVTPSDTPDLPLAGLSKNTYNIVAMYEKGPIQARIAYNKRSKYLLTPRDVITFLPMWSDSTHTVDATLYYDINENVQVGVQAVNLTNSETRLRMQYNPQGDTTGRSWFVNDRKFTFLLRANF